MLDAVGAWRLVDHLAFHARRGVPVVGLEPADGGGTLVTSYYDWSNLHEQYAGFADRFPIISEASLRATLGILARTVAPGRGRPDA